MNPLDYWYNSNDNLKLFFDKYYVDHIDGIKSHSEFMVDVKLLYETGSVTEKCQVISLLSAINQFEVN